MIFNLVQYLRDEFPAKKFYTNDAIANMGEEFIPDRHAVIEESGGTQTAWNHFISQLIMTKYMDIEGPKARAFAYLVYEDLLTRVGLLLPEKTVDGTLFPAVKVSQISANAPPFNLGADDQGRIVFTTNFTVIYSK